MKRILGISLCGLLLAGCAGGGRYVATGPVNYNHFLSALACQVAELHDVDQATAKMFDGGRADLTVKIEGAFERDAAFAGTLPSYAGSGPILLDADAGLSRKFTDQGWVTLTREQPLAEARSACDKLDGNEVRYDASALGLAAWYRNVANRVDLPRGYPDDDILNPVLKFEREAVLQIGKNGVGVRLERTVPYFRKFRAGVYLTRTENILITIELVRFTPPSEPKAQLVTLSPETLLELKRLFVQRERFQPSPVDRSRIKAATDPQSDELTDEIRDLRDEIETLQQLQVQ